MCRCIEGPAACTSQAQPWAGKNSESGATSAPVYTSGNTSGYVAGDSSCYNIGRASGFSNTHILSQEEILGIIRSQPAAHEEKPPPSPSLKVKGYQGPSHPPSEGFTGIFLEASGAVHHICVSSVSGNGSWPDIETTPMTWTSQGGTAAEPTLCTGSDSPQDKWPAAFRSTGADNSASESSASANSTSDRSASPNSASESSASANSAPENSAPERADLHSKHGERGGQSPCPAAHITAPRLSLIIPPPPPQNPPTSPPAVSIPSPQTVHLFHEATPNVLPASGPELLPPPFPSLPLSPLPVLPLSPRPSLEQRLRLLVLQQRRTVKNPGGAPARGACNERRFEFGSNTVMPHVERERNTHPKPSLMMVEGLSSPTISPIISPVPSPRTALLFDGADWRERTGKDALPAGISPRGIDAQKNLHDETAIRVTRVTTSPTSPILPVPDSTISTALRRLRDTRCKITGEQPAQLSKGADVATCKKIRMVEETYVAADNKQGKEAKGITLSLSGALLSRRKRNWYEANGKATATVDMESKHQEREEEAENGKRNARGIQDEGKEGEGDDIEGIDQVSILEGIWESQECNNIEDILDNGVDAVCLRRTGSAEATHITIGRGSNKLVIPCIELESLDMLFQ